MTPPAHLVLVGACSPMDLVDGGAVADPWQPAAPAQPLLRRRAPRDRQFGAGLSTKGTMRPGHDPGCERSGDGHRSDETDTPDEGLDDLDGDGLPGHDLRESETLIYRRLCEAPRAPSAVDGRASGGDSRRQRTAEGAE